MQAKSNQLVHTWVQLQYCTICAQLTSHQSLSIHHYHLTAKNTHAINVGGLINQVNA